MQWLFHILIMIAIQALVMPFVMVADRDHVEFSLTQVYMGAFMGACMVLVEGLAMAGHVPLPWYGWVVTIAVGILAVVAYHRQWFIDDRGYLREMIPHHSMALVTSAARLNTQDPRVQRLADQIIVTQRREISEMRHILADVKRQ
jgi:Domain of unknown function (DUF305)